jgi:hypothetical protein
VQRPLACDLVSVIHLLQLAASVRLQGAGHFAVSSAYQATEAARHDVEIWRVRARIEALHVIAPEQPQFPWSTETSQQPSVAIVHHVKRNAMSQATLQYTLSTKLLGGQSPFSLRNTDMILRPVRLLHSPVVLDQTSVQDISLCRGIISPLPFQVSNGCFSLLASVESVPGTSVPSIETCPEFRLASVEQGVVLARLCHISRHSWTRADGELTGR